MHVQMVNEATNIFIKAEKIFSQCLDCLFYSNSVYHMSSAIFIYDITLVL